MFSVAKGALKYRYPKLREGFSETFITLNGNIYAGASNVSDTFTLNMHSEAVALAHAANHEEKDIQLLVQTVISANSLSGKIV